LTPDPAYANIGMYRRMKNLTWLADSRSNVKAFPAGVQDDIGRDAEAGDGPYPAAA
jgi:hypothetical protein